MKKTFISAAFLAAVLAFTPSPSGAQGTGKAMEVFSVTDKVIKSCAGLDLISRDEFWKGKLNTLLEGKGKVVSVEEHPQFRRKFRITLTGGGDVALVYYIYTDNEEYTKLLLPGTLFGFKGQFVMFTPLNSKRNLYLLDLLLEDGAALVE